MDISTFMKELKYLGAEFFTGVPDSQLKYLCNYLIDEYGVSEHHIIAANEGNCVGIAAGYYLATNKIPVVYMQNSGIGNATNPIVSLLNKKVYGIPCIFIIGWRGEPGKKDEPQHIVQGEITTNLLTDLGINYYIIDENSSREELLKKREEEKSILEEGNSIAFLIKKDAFIGDDRKYINNYLLTREEAIEEIIQFAKEDIIVSTTGKISRELFEVREKKQLSHKYDFLTVGSMGHASSIALGISLNKPNTKVWCIDGDGALLMHMGALAVIGANSPKNLIHIVINNESHESVGGIPTVANKINLSNIAKGCGYDEVYSINSKEELIQTLIKTKEMKKLVFIEVKVSMITRKDLGRPTKTPQENKINFMKYIQNLS